MMDETDGEMRMDLRNNAYWMMMKDHLMPATMTIMITRKLSQQRLLLRANIITTLTMTVIMVPDVSFKLEGI